MSEHAARLEELRAELRAERISYGELVELQSLAEHIQPGDVELLEAAGVPEHAPEPPTGRDLREMYDDGAQGRADVDMGELLGAILADVQDSYRLAMQDAGVHPATAHVVDTTVTDYIVNHYGDDS